MKQMNGKTEYYNRMLKLGEEYQDFIAKILFQQCALSIIPNFSQTYQITVGENLQGIEIKYDQRFRDTQNFYIEMAEKTNARNRNYIPSGINRIDNTWLFLIGDYDGFYIFSKRLLIYLESIKPYRHVETATSQGFLLPIEPDSELYYARKLTLNGDIWHIS